MIYIAQKCFKVFIMITTKVKIWITMTPVTSGFLCVLFCNLFMIFNIFHTVNSRMCEKNQLNQKCRPVMKCALIMIWGNDMLGE